MSLSVMRIFISYTTRDHRDRALAQRITDGLKARAVDVFYAPQSLRGGAEWKDELRAELSSRANRPEPVVLAQHEIRSHAWSRITARR